MKCLLAAVAVIGASLVCGDITPPTIYKCDDTAIKWVNVIWKAQGHPSNIVSKRDNAKVGLVATSLDYIAEGECKTGEFHGNSATWTISNNKGEKTTFNEDYTEDPANPGIVTSNDGNIKRYFVFSKNGVDSYYICSTDGPAGDPQGVVSAKLKLLDDSTLDMADLGAALLQYVGVKVNETDIKTCFPQKK